MLEDTTATRLQRLEDKLDRLSEEIAAHNHGIDVFWQTTWPSLVDRVKTLEARVWQIGIAGAATGAMVGGASGIAAALWP